MYMNPDRFINEIMRSAEFDIVSHAIFCPEPFLTQKHCHVHYQVSYMAGGSNAIQVSGHEFTLKEGDVMFVRPGQWHGPGRNARRERAELLQVKFTLGKSLPLRMPDLVHVDSRMEYEAVFQRMLLEFHMRRPLRESMLRSCLAQLVLILCRSAGGFSRKQPSKPSPALSVRDELKVRKAMEWILLHYRERIRMEDIAAAAGMSASGLSHSFKKLAGEAPVRYLVDYRLSQALGLMERTDEKLDAIAEAAGFSDAGYMSRMFKKRFKQPPRPYLHLLAGAK